MKISPKKTSITLTTSGGKCTVYTNMSILTDSKIGRHQTFSNYIFTNLIISIWRKMIWLKPDLLFATMITWKFVPWTRGYKNLYGLTGGYESSYIFLCWYIMQTWFKLIFGGHNLIIIFEVYTLITSIHSILYTSATINIFLFSTSHIIFYIAVKILMFL